MTTEGEATTMAETTFWSARQILAVLVDPAQRQKIISTFWRRGDSHARALAIVHLAGAMRFREESLRKATPDKKAEWLWARSSKPELAECLEMALMLHHTTEKAAMMSDFLDQWNIPHVNGTIESDDYKAPTREAVARAAAELEPKYGRHDIVLYLATAGLLMGAGEKEWREAMWPVVDELQAAPAKS